jgi:hypothetical protein
MQHRLHLKIAMFIHRTQLVKTRKRTRDKSDIRFASEVVSP